MAVCWRDLLQHCGSDQVYAVSEAGPREASWWWLRSSQTRQRSGFLRHIAQKVSWAKSPCSAEGLVSTSKTSSGKSRGHAPAPLCHPALEAPSLSPCQDWTQSPLQWDKEESLRLLSRALLQGSYSKLLKAKINARSSKVERQISFYLATGPRRLNPHDPGECLIGADQQWAESTFVCGHKRIHPDVWAWRLWLSGDHERSSAYFAWLPKAAVPLSTNIRHWGMAGSRAETIAP